MDASENHESQNGVAMMMSEAQTPKLLSLDDEPEISELLTSIARSAGFRCESASTAREFLARIGEFSPDVITLDLQIPDMDGIEVLRQVAARRLECAIVIVTGMDTRTIGAAEYYARALDLRVVGTLQKPFEPSRLTDLLAEARSLQQLPTMQDFACAIEDRELVVHYQPVARRTSDGWSIDAVEALLRWDHPHRGRLMPHDFMRFAADDSLNRAMTDYVIQEGLQQLKGWRTSSLELGLRVNLSAALITDVEFPDRLETALLTHEIPAYMLIIEVNETDMLAGHAATIDILTRLRVKNIGLAIDDFGIGYSSLTQLFRMPFSEMKIDGSLIARTAESREGRIAVEALIELAHKLELEVCAEGVETQAVVDALWDAGCDAAQGYFVSPPLPAREVAGALRRWHESSMSQRDTGANDPKLEVLNG